MSLLKDSFLCKRMYCVMVIGEVLPLNCSHVKNLGWTMGIKVTDYRVIYRKYRKKGGHDLSQILVHNINEQSRKTEGKRTLERCQTEGSRHTVIVKTFNAIGVDRDENLLSYEEKDSTRSQKMYQSQSNP